MDPKVLEDCDRLAFEGKMNFPESIRQMALTGVERYRADLVSWEKMHYSADGETCGVSMTLPDAPAIAQEFDEGGVKAALNSIQKGRIDYGEFLRRIMRAGVTDYGVWLDGRLAIYFGRAGEFYMERFPGTR